MTVWSSPSRRREGRDCRCDSHRKSRLKGPQATAATAVLQPFVKLNGTAAHVTVRGPCHLTIPGLSQNSFAIIRLYHSPCIARSNSAEQNQDQENDDNEP
jgi:hypothetical protein